MPPVENMATQSRGHATRQRCLACVWDLGYNPGAMRPTSPLSIMFVDLNAYFASVEQQVRPELRGRPIVVTPVDADTTCCIASSYEARPFGIKTGTAVGEAKRLCPELIVVHARHKLYIEHHHRILEAADTVLPVEEVESVDEFRCRLIGAERERAEAVRLALAMKKAIRSRVGNFLRCSIGIGPNRLLAKVGTNLQKPDGLVVIESHELPERLHQMKLTDFPGIAKGVERRLNAHGIERVDQLCALSAKQMVDAWGSVVGRHWWHWLRGEDIPSAPTARRTVGHQHVLPPSHRTREQAYTVAVRLLAKAAARLRRLEHWAERLTVRVTYFDTPRWKMTVTLPMTQDTLVMLAALRKMWATSPTRARPLQVGVRLHRLTHARHVEAPLFPADRKRQLLLGAMDTINERFGYDAVYPGSMHGAKSTAPMRIAFGKPPDLSIPDLCEDDEAETF